MTDLAAFWSYVRKDDDAEGGRILALADAIEVEYESRTNETLRIFRDKRDIGLGDEWQQRIDEGLARTTALIAMITPRFIASAACRKEVNDFFDATSRAGLPQLLIPILWFSIENLESDEFVEKIRSRQWSDWDQAQIGRAWNGAPSGRCR
jgi:hypothetical protein